MCHFLGVFFECEAGLSLETEEEAAVDNSPERMDVADAEAPRPLRIETAVGF